MEEYNAKVEVLRVNPIKKQTKEIVEKLDEEKKHRVT
jgi:hypothetical protein